MKPSEKSVFFATLIIVLAATFAQPNCVTHPNRDVICTGGDNDFVLRRGLVSDNNRTTGITLKGCRITDLDYEAFKNDENLKYIDLSENRISRLKLGVLDESKQVTYLNLSYNILTTFPLGLFDQKPNLEILDLKANKLNLLERGIFDPFRKLKHLDLSTNSLLGRDMDPELFRNCREIRFIDFSRNDMSNSQEELLNPLINIDFLNLDRCSLKEVPSFATRPNLKTMKHMMLSNNQISKIEHSGTFANLDNLEIINLAENVIEDLTADLFRSLKYLKMVVLRDNRLKTVPDTIFTNLKAIGNVDLSYNFIEYVPVNAFRGTSIKYLNLSHNKFSYLEANFCLELRNSGVRLKKFYFNDNPWQCACLNEILKEMKTYSVRYNNVKYNGAYAICVTTKHFTCKRQMSDNDIFIEMYNNRGK